MAYPSLKTRGVTVAQFPNPPLIAAIVAAIVRRIAADGSDLQDGAAAVFYVALAIWAWEEAAHGDSWFRRLLGVAGLVFVVVAVTSAMG